jgi:hypothetical protein
VLIVAIPKSASTALAATLSEAHALPIESQRIRDQELVGAPRAPGYWQVGQFHRRDFIEIDARIARILAAPERLAKFHLPPTAQNQAVLRDVKKIVLLRDASEIVSAYRRGEESGAWKTKSYEFAFCFTEAGWQRRARATGLVDELAAFADGWRAHDGDKLVVESDELLEDPAGVLARVESYFGLPSSGLSELRRERFSRAGEKRSIPRILWRRRKLLLRRALAGANQLVAGNADWSNATFERRRRARDELRKAASATPRARE